MAKSRSTAAVAARAALALAAGCGDDVRNECPIGPPQWQPADYDGFLLHCDVVPELCGLAVESTKMGLLPRSDRRHAPAVFSTTRGEARMRLAVGYVRPMYRAVLIGIACAASACVPILSPPVSGKLGFAYASQRVDIGGGKSTHYLGNTTIGLDTASLSESPVHGGFGVEGVAGYGGVYATTGWIRRIAPKWRFGVNGAGSRYWTDDGGYGARTGLTLEYTTAHESSADKDYDPGSDGTHNQTTTYLARHGSFAIGAYLDVWYRWLDENPNDVCVSFGLSFRLAAAAGIVDATGQH